MAEKHKIYTIFLRFIRGIFCKKNGFDICNGSKVSYQTTEFLKFCQNAVYIRSFSMYTTDKICLSVCIGG